MWAPAANTCGNIPDFMNKLTHGRTLAEYNIDGK